jgi:hypothetical protein
MITEAKDILERAARDRIPGAEIARSVSEESRAIMARKLPLVTLVTGPGGFDDREAQTYRYYDEAEIQFTVSVALEEETVPTIGAVEVEPGAVKLL